MRLAEQTEHIGFRTSPEHARALWRIAKDRGLNRSELLREMVEIVVSTEVEPRRPTLDDVTEANVFIARAARRRR